MECIYKHKWDSWDEVIERDASIYDIDPASVNIFLQAAKKVGRVPELDSIPITAFLKTLNLMENEKPKRGAIALFGKNPNRFYDNIMVKLTRLGTDYYDFKFQEIVEGNIIQLLKVIPELLNRDFFTKPVDFGNLEHVEKGEYPAGAIHEMLLNAIIHRDYMGGPTEIMVYDDCFSILNAGILPLELTIKSLGEQHPSNPRSPLIADVCHKGGFIDASGGGMLKIFNLTNAAGLPEPVIKVAHGEFMVRLCKSVE